MRHSKYTIAILAGALLLVSSCQQEPEGPTGSDKIATRVTGTVVRSDDGSPVPLAVVQDVSLSTRRDTTDANGEYELVFQMDPGQTLTTSIFARRDLFGNDTAAVSLRAGADTSITLTLVADSTSPVTSVRSGRPASIVLIGTDVSSISIRGSGVNESALLTYEVRDSLGNPITGEATPDTVRFNIIGGPSGGEYVFPKMSRINATTGRVTTRLNSGTKPGVIQVQASARNDSVISAPARITIASGPPDSANVSISREKANIPGLVFDNERAGITVILGDRYQNPVPEGTAVYFTTNMGLIQATGKTDADGIASVSLISANPRPPGLGGVATVIARTIGDTAVRAADSLIERRITVVFSGVTQIIAPTTPIVLPDSGSSLLQFQVRDQNGNPLTEGSTISVTAAGAAGDELVLTGDTEVTLESTDDPAMTNFAVLVSDNTRGGLSGYFTIKIEVKSKNGDREAVVQGYLQSTGGGGISAGSTYPKTITLSNITNRTLSVKGTGSNETSRLTFVVRDSLGNPIGNPLDPTVNAKVRFSVTPTYGSGGGEVLSSYFDSTDINGFVTVTFTAGTKAGVVQLVAKTVDQQGDTLKASPVQLTVFGGLPDSNRFVAKLSQVNMPGLIETGQMATVAVQAADEFGNPAAPGTAIYFSTTLGLVQATAFLNEEGRVQVNLNGGAVNTNVSAGTVTAQTLGKDGETVRRMLPFLFTGQSQITGLPTVPFLISDSGSYAFSYVVSDQNGNPLSPGTTISVAAEGPGSGDLELAGDVEVTLPDVTSGYTNFSVRAFDKSKGGVSGPVTFRISVASDNGDVEATHTGAVLGQGQSAATGGGSTLAQSIELLAISPSEPVVLSVAGTGVNEAAVIQFIVKDSLGSPVDEAHAADVVFTIHGGPGGQEFVFPQTVKTDASGLVNTTFNAGTKAGVLQVKASTTVNGRVVSSAPIPITIVGGLPDSAHISVWTDRSNYPGDKAGEQIGVVQVQLGDQYGNPAQPNTAVYFTTNGGIIQGSSFSDVFGRASAAFFGGAPAPPGGLDTITVSMVDRNNNAQKRYLTPIFSGTPIITLTSTVTDSITVFDGGYFDLAFTVADLNGNPLAEGNLISASVSGTASAGIGLSGDNGVATIDTKNPALTAFSIRVADNTPNGGVSGPFRVTIKVEGPNGTATKQIYGTLGAPQAITPPSPTVKNPAQIAFIGISASDIYVQGVGALENTVITYEVRDSLGSPIEANPRAYATFSFTFAPNSWAPQGTAPRLIPNADSTDNAGRLRVSLSSGTTAGIVQIVATVIVGGNPIVSRPVKVTIHAGFPDQDHFTMGTARLNFPGLDKNFVTNGITVQVGDKYSNPVEQGTAVYFNTSHGIVTTGGGAGLTDLTGFVSQTLYSGNPRPEGADSLSIGAGYTYLYARTIGDGGVEVIDSVEILWTGVPIITLVSGPASFAIPQGGSDGPWVFTVQDRYFHPMSSGTAITVSAGSGKISGDADIIMNDTKASGAGLTQFTISLADSDPADVDPTETVLLTVVVNHPTYGVFKKIIATGTIE